MPIFLRSSSKTNKSRVGLTQLVTVSWVPCSGLEFARIPLLTEKKWDGL